MAYSRIGRGGSGDRDWFKTFNTLPSATTAVTRSTGLIFHVVFKVSSGLLWDRGGGMHTSQWALNNGQAHMGDPCQLCIRDKGSSVTENHS